MMTPLFAWVAAAALFQGGAEEIARQAARLTDKDPRQSFNAVSRLAEVAAKSKPAVESAVAGLPKELAFYREALAEEIRVRETMGALYPALVRHSFDFKDQTPLSAWTQVSNMFGEKLELNFIRRVSGAALFNLELRDLTFMESLEEVSRGTKTGIFLNGAMLAVNPAQVTAGTCAYRNYMILMQRAVRSRKIEFGAGETRSLQVWLQIIGDSTGRLVRITRPRIAEAVDGDGVAVAELPENPKDEESEAPTKPEASFQVAVPWHQSRVTLALPKSDTLARLRGWFDVVLSGESSGFDFTDLSKPTKQTDEHFEVEVERIAEAESPKIVVRVTPKDGIKGYLTMAAEAKGSWKVGKGEQPLYLPGKVEGNQVKYTLVLPGAEAGRAQELTSIRLKFHRAAVERRIPFEFRDLEFK